MKARSLKQLAIAAVVVAIAAPGCAGGGERVTETKLLNKLQAAGLKVERLAEPIAHADQLERLPDTPQSMFAAKVADGHGNREPMTFVLFRTGDDALDAAKHQNGFAVHNWFVMGIVSNHMKHHIEGAFE